MNKPGRLSIIIVTYLLLFVGVALPADSTSVLDLAVNLLHSGRFDEAAKLLSGYKCPGESLGLYHFLYAEAMEGGGRSSAASDHYRLAYLYSPEGAMKESALFKRASLYLGGRLYYEARSAFLLFLNKYPRSPNSMQAESGLAACLSALGLYKEALAHYEKSGGGAEAAFGKADALQRLGMIREAEKAYAEAFRKNPFFDGKSDESLYLFGENNRMAGRSADAKKAFRAVRRPPFRYEADISLGSIFAGENNPREASKYFGRAMESDSADIRSRALYLRARLQSSGGDVKGAKDLLFQILVKYPYTPQYQQAMLMLSDICSEEGNSAETLRILIKLIYEKGPSNEALDRFEAIIAKAMDSGNEGEWVSAWKTAGTFLLQKTREKFLLRTAHSLRKAEPKEFVSICAWLTKNGSDSAKAESSEALAEYYAENGDVRTARQYFDKLQNKNHSDGALRMEALIYYGEQNFRAAAEKLLGIKKPTPADIKILGQVFTEAGDKTRAAARYERELKNSGGDSEELTELADYLYGLGKKAEAVRYYKLALDKDPGNEWAAYRTSASPQPGKAEETQPPAKGDSVFGRSAGLRKKELEISERAREMF